MGTPQNDSAGWAGWAISSFTSKLATASGDMQYQTAKAQLPKIDRSSSVSPAADSIRPPPLSVPSTLQRQAVTGTSTPVVAPTPADLYFSNPLEDDGDIDEPWGGLTEETFFDAPNEPKSASVTPITFDDGGEPDFEGWLKAQAQAKSKAPLPKGLGKPAVPFSNGRKAVTRMTTTGSAGSAAGPKKLAGAINKPKSATMSMKAISTEPKEAAADDWGDAWD